MYKKFVSSTASVLLLFSFFGWLASGAVTNALATDLVNINSADAETISNALIGIGPVKAQAIVDYRQEYGDFARLQDLQNVPGIGESMFDRIKASLSLTDSSAEPAATAQLKTSPQ